MLTVKNKNILDIMGKPIASSTPRKELFDTSKKHFPKMKQKTIRNDKSPFSDRNRRTNIPIRNYVELEIVSSGTDSDSDSVPPKKCRLLTPKVNQSLKVLNRNGPGRKEKLSVHPKVKRPATSLGKDDDKMSPAASKNVSNNKRIPHKRPRRSTENSDINNDLNNKDQERVQIKPLKKKQEPRQSNSKPAKKSEKNKSVDSFSKKNSSSQNGTKKISSSSKFSQSEAKINSSVAKERKINPPSYYESSSSESECNEGDDDTAGRKKAFVKKNTNVSQKNKLAAKSPEKISDDLQKQANVSDDRTKKTVTPVTGMPAARQRQSLSRTLSRIAASSSDKFMVEIPKNLAESFSASLKLIKRRIDFETNEKQRVEDEDEPKNTSEAQAKSKKQEKSNKGREEDKRKKIQKRTLKSTPENETNVVSRKLTALAPVYSADKETSENKPNNSIKGVRRSTRSRIPPINYWEGSVENDQLFAQNHVQKSHSRNASLASHPPKNKNNLKRHSSLRTTKDDIGQVKTTAARKSVQWEDISRNNNSKVTAAENRMKVCYSTFDQSAFLPADVDSDGEESGVQYAESLHVHGIQSEYIRLLPGAETTDMLSQNNNQLYTVLENKVSLLAEGVPKRFGLHSQFYIQKGVSHKLQNNSNKASLVLQVVIM